MELRTQAHGDPQSSPEHWQHERHAAAGAAADASDSDSDSAQLSEPSVLESEPRSTEENINSDLRVEALDEEVNQMLQEMQEVPLPTLASATNHLESSANT